jgi:hypothetical protein
MLDLPAQHFNNLPALHIPSEGQKPMFPAVREMVGPIAAGSEQPFWTKSKSHNSLPSAPKLNAAKSLSPCGYLRSLRLRVFESFKDSEVTKRL